MIIDKFKQLTKRCEKSGAHRLLYFHAKNIMGCTADNKYNIINRCHMNYLIFRLC